MKSVPLPCVLFFPHIRTNNPSMSLVSVFKVVYYMAVFGTSLSRDLPSTVVEQGIRIMKDRIAIDLRVGNMSENASATQDTRNSLNFSSQV